MNSLLNQNGGETPEEGTQDSAAAPEQAEGTRPDFIPEKFWDAEAGAPNVENLAKSYAELERRGNSVSDEKVAELRSQFEQDRLANRPETSDGYTLPQDERFDGDALSASPVVSLWRKAAHEAGLDDKQFQGVLSQYADAEIARIDAAARAEMEKLGDTAQDRVDAVSKFAQASFPEEEFAAVAQVASTAAGVAALERIMKMAQETGVSDLGGGEPVQAGDTLEEIQKLMDTPEYFDPARRKKEVTDRVAAFFAKNPS